MGCRDENSRIIIRGRGAHMACIDEWVDDLGGDSHLRSTWKEDMANLAQIARSNSCGEREREREREKRWCVFQNAFSRTGDKDVNILPLLPRN